MEEFRQTVSVYYSKTLFIHFCNEYLLKTSAGGGE
jgi:hypothetical protein